MDWSVTSSQRPKLLGHLGRLDLKRPAHQTGHQADHAKQGVCFHGQQYLGAAPENTTPYAAAGGAGALGTSAKKNLPSGAECGCFCIN